MCWTGWANGSRPGITCSSPWQDVLRWLEGFPDAATRCMGMGDLSIQQEWQTCCTRYPLSHVWVWTLDSDLAALDRLSPSAASRRKT
jgi:hypothetical protein